ncbi:Uncharacterised protein [Streptococcus pneumoniae]|nr:Uncharacterised protein [Streptococcus pneumoniae]CJC11262.1 Uncharacterised protein [Streptococcus pneumoniae]CJH86332.1 Uncharacterised protein [Streptococcus pneumoniae]COT91997.1 Uncharacterised protein [Streptococcus pneumoniae]
MPYCPSPVKKTRSNDPRPPGTRLTTPAKAAITYTPKNFWNSISMPNNSNMTYITIPADTHSTNETNEYKTVGFFSSSSCSSVCVAFLFFNLENPIYIGTKRAKKIRTGHSHGFSCKINLVSNIPIRPRNERMANPLIKAVVIQAILLISFPFSFIYGR